MSDSTTYKIDMPKEVTFDKMQDIIRQHLNKPDYILSQDRYELWIKSNEEEDEQRAIITSVLGKLYDEYKDKTDRESEKRKAEMQGLAYYIRSSSKKITILDMRESPDFIVDVEGKKVGIELTSIYDPDIVDGVQIQYKVAGLAEDLIKSKKGAKNFLYSVQLDPEKVFKTKNKKDLPIELANYLMAASENPDAAKPDYILKTVISKHSAIQIKVLEEYYLKPINTDLIDDLIKQKEGKLEQYRANTGVEDQWLLIILEGSSAMTNFEITPELLPKREVAFNKVIVFNTFKGFGIESQ